MDCFGSYEEWYEFWIGTLVLPKIDIKYGFEDQNDYRYFESQVPIMEERWQTLKGVCLKGPSGQFLPYVGTTATVRDLVAIAEHFDGKGCDINYYGISYGTTIGNYLVNSKLYILCSKLRFSHASVFPDRVGRIILDGVQDPVIHANRPSHLHWAHTVESVDEAFQGFAQGCAMAGPYGCSIATDTSTGPGIVDWTRTLVEVREIAVNDLRLHLNLK